MKASKADASNTNTASTSAKDRPGTDKPRAAVLHELAAAYIERGLSVVPLTALTKKPRVTKWQEKNFTADSFQGDDNIGVKLGNASHHLVDIDLDVPEARTLAGLFFDHLPMFGRHSAPGSHRLVRCADHPKKTERFELSDTKLAADLLGMKPGTEDKTVVLELRITGQTMFPPSVHPSGELVEWVGEIPETIPQAKAWDDIRRNAGLLAFLALVLRAYPRVQGSRDNICMALSGALIDMGLDDADANALVIAIARAAGDEEASTRGKVQQTRAKKEAGEAVTGLPALLKELGIEGFEKDVRKWLGLGKNKSAPEGAIFFEAGELPNILNRVEAALLASDILIYQRGELVRPIRTKRFSEEGGVKRRKGALMLLPVEAPWLLEKMILTTPFYKMTDDGPRKADPSMKLAGHLLARKGEWNFPELRAVLAAPTLALDGRIIEVPGYDEDSGLLLDIEAGSFPPVPPEPTKAEAQAALKKLDQLLRGFPFPNAAARSVALSAMLTALVRPSLRTAPLHAFDAPAAGTGKSKLTEMPAQLVSGVKPATMSFGHSVEECEKRLSTVLRAGDLLIVIDNCVGEIDGEFLCSMLTQEVVQARILGLSERVVLPCTAFVMASGNNIAIVGDTTRRTVICRIDARCEKPEERPFDFDCQEELMAARPELVVAGLTALRAYKLAKDKPKLRTFGSFDDWDWIRGTLVWTGYADPVETRDEIVANDPHKNELMEVMDAWEAAYGERGVTTAEIQNDGSTAPAASQMERLYRLLLEVTRQREWNGRSVGKWLGYRRDRVIGGRRFTSTEKEDNQKVWKLEGVGKTEKVEERGF